MPHSYLYMIELIVDELNIWDLPSDVTPEMESCVHFELLDNVYMEVCECDFGSTFATSSAKKGKNCLFTFQRSLPPDMLLSVTAYKKQPNDTKKKLGSVEFDVRPVFERITAAYEKQEATSSAETVMDVSAFSALSMKSVKRQSLLPASEWEPVSESLKQMLPLSDVKGEPVGWAVLMMRFTCYGQTITQPVMLDVTATMDGKKSEVLFGGRPSAGSTDIYKIQKYLEEKESDLDSDLDSEMCRGRPPSRVESEESLPPSNYDEYKAILNGNALVIRINKNSNLTAKLVEDDSGGDGLINYDFNDRKVCIEVPESAKSRPKIQSISTSKCPMGPHCPLARVLNKKSGPTFKPQTNACKLPVIRGNLKYPSITRNFNIEMCQNGTDPVERFRRRKSKERTVAVDCQETHLNSPDTSPPGVEVCKKDWDDPDADVFLLKIAKCRDDPESQQELEVELRTPKGPDYERREKCSRTAQVMEEYFENKKADVKGGKEKGGKKGKKGGKGKGKKGKK